LVPNEAAVEAAPFTVETLALRFVFGGRTLRTARLPGRILRTHATRLAPQAAETPPDASWFDGGLRAVQIPACPVASRLPARAKVGGLLRYVPMQGVLRFVRLGPSLDDYYSRLTPKGRHELKRKTKRFREEAGPDAGISVHRTPDEATAFHRAARELSARTYQERRLDAGLPAGDAYLEELRTAAAADRFRGFLLARGGRTLAYGACRAFEDDVLWYEHTGYDVEARALNPGIALLHGMIDALVAEGRFKILDYGFGEAQYKRETATDHLDVARLWWLRPTLGNRALVLAHAALDGASDAATRTVARLGLKERLVRRMKRGGP
jgi:hypothetical protein